MCIFGCISRQKEKCTFLLGVKIIPPKLLSGVQCGLSLKQDSASYKGIAFKQSKTEGSDVWPKNQHQLPPSWIWGTPQARITPGDGRPRLWVKGLTGLIRERWVFLSTTGKIWRIGLQHDKELKDITNPERKQMSCSQKFPSKRWH